MWGWHAHTIHEDITFRRGNASEGKAALQLQTLCILFKCVHDCCRPLGSELKDAVTSCCECVASVCSCQMRRFEKQERAVHGCVWKEKQCTVAKLCPCDTAKRHVVSEHRLRFKCCLRCLHAPAVTCTRLLISLTDRCCTASSTSAARSIPRMSWFDSVKQCTTLSIDMV